MLGAGRSEQKEVRAKRCPGGRWSVLPFWINVYAAFPLTLFVNSVDLSVLAAPGFLVGVAFFNSKIKQWCGHLR
jgi:hypothetical protein